MNILVEGRPAVLKKGFSFEYIAENRLFLGRDGYTMNITFPIRGCTQNLEIFGHIHRIDAAKEKVDFDCAIIDRHVSLFGRLLVTKVSEVEIECQFAEGRCAQVATDPFEDTYINNLDLGSAGIVSATAVSPSEAWKGFSAGAVALPWVNTETPTAPNNWVTEKNGQFVWDSEVTRLSWQPYLIVIAERICEAIGYTYDFSEWRGSPKKYLLVCNTLPASWDLPDFARALPAWTVSEFFEKLELFLMCEFDFDHKAKTVKMQFSASALAAVAPVRIDEVVDTYEVALTQDDSGSCDYIGAKRLAYKECSHSMWPYYSCDWFLQAHGPSGIIKYSTLASLISENKLRIIDHGNYKTWLWGFTWTPSAPDRGRSDSSVKYLLYAEDVDTYFAFRSIGTEYLGNVPTPLKPYAQIYVLQPVNVFGSGSPENDDVATEEIDFVPVCIADTHVSNSDDRGFMMFLDPSGYSEHTDDGSSDAADVTQPPIAAMLERGEQEKCAAYYDVIYLAFWDGNWQSPGLPPYPIVDSVSVRQDWSVYRDNRFSMRLFGGPSTAEKAVFTELPQVNPKQKFKFSWLGHCIPDPRAIFYIAGRRYVCEKVTATFTEDGMSQLLKGEFFPLADD